MRSSWLFGPIGPQLRPHDAARSAPSATRSRSSTTSAAARPTSAISPRRSGELVELPFGVYHVAAGGDCTWADFAEAIFEEAGLDCRVRRITTAEFGAKAPRPAYSVLRSEKGAPELPHWRDGLRECLARLALSLRSPHAPAFLREREFRLLWAGQTVSVVGDGCFTIALSFAVLDLTGSVSDLGLVLRRLAGCRSSSPFLPGASSPIACPGGR